MFSFLDKPMGALNNTRCYHAMKKKLMSQVYMSSSKNAKKRDNYWNM